MIFILRLKEKMISVNFQEVFKLKNKFHSKMQPSESQRKTVTVNVLTIFEVYLQVPGY